MKVDSLLLEEPLVLSNIKIDVAEVVHRFGHAHIEHAVGRGRGLGTGATCRKAQHGRGHHGGQPRATFRESGYTHGDAPWLLGLPTGRSARTHVWVREQAQR